jgi:hypothetical protein
MSKYETNPNVRIEERCEYSYNVFYQGKYSGFVARLYKMRNSSNFAYSIIDSGASDSSVTNEHFYSLGDAIDYLVDWIEAV